jgi:hypothetical protein
MKTTLVHGEHGALSDVLAGILGRLQGRYYGPFHGGLEEDLHRQADGCVERLAGHLRDAEETFLPALRTVGPAAAHDIEELEKDHRLLGLHARYLAVQIREKDGVKAYGVARSFLAVVLHHIRRETGASGRCAHALEVTDAKRLRGLIDRSCSHDKIESRFERGAEAKPQGERLNPLRGD